MATIVAITVLVIGIIPTFATTSPVVTIYTQAVWGPPTNAPGYIPWANMIASNVYAGVTLSNDWHLQTPYFVQNSTNQTNNTVWYLNHMVSNSTNYMFSPTGMTFNASSSDSANVFYESFSYSTGNFIYTPHAIGVKWGPGGARKSDTLLTTGSWTNPVNEFIFIGHEATYWICTNSTQYTQVDSYFSGATVNMRATGTFTFNDGVNPSVSASKSFYRQTQPSAPTLTINRAGNQVETVSASPISPYDSWIIQGTLNLQPTSWTNITSLSGGLTAFNWQNGTNKMELFRAVLE